MVDISVTTSKTRNTARQREERSRRTRLSATTLTLTIGGDVPLDLFVQTMQQLQRLIDLLTREVSRDASITWTVDELPAGSAAVTIAGEAQQPDAVERVIRAFLVVGQALERQQILPYSSSVEQAARSFKQLISGRISFVQFDALGEVATITTDVPGEPNIGLVGADGSVEGRIETLISRHRLGFTLYDSLHDRAIPCHIDAGQIDAARNAWGHRAIVQGWIRRHPVSSQPVSIDPVRAIEVLPEVEPGSYRRARAILPVNPDEPSPDVIVRRLRDA